MTKEEAKLVKQLIALANRWANIEFKCGMAIGKSGACGIGLGQKAERAREEYDEVTSALRKLMKAKP